MPYLSATSAVAAYEVAHDEDFLSRFIPPPFLPPRA
jgi:hypothetical protein